MTLPANAYQPAGVVTDSESGPMIQTSPAVRIAGAEQPAVDPEVALEIARYIHQLSGEMATMARKSGLDLLAYFLDMARIEAKNVERRSRR